MFNHGCAWQFQLEMRYDWLVYKILCVNSALIAIAILCQIWHILLILQPMFVRFSPAQPTTSSRLTMADSFPLFGQPRMPMMPTQVQWERWPSRLWRKCPNRRKPLCSHLHFTRSLSGNRKEYHQDISNNRGVIKLMAFDRGTTKPFSTHTTQKYGPNCMYCIQGSKALVVWASL